MGYSHERNGNPAIGHDDAVDQVDGAEQHEKDRILRAAPAWLISLIIHAVILGALAAIYIVVKQDKDEVPLQVAALPPPPPEEEKPEVERELKPMEVTLEVEVEIETPSPVSELDVPVEEFSRETEVESEVPKGREEAVADSEMGGSGAFMAIGAGGGASGMFGSRSGGGKKRALGRFGGSRESESAVLAALRWFKRHQSPDGRWDQKNYHLNCTEQPRCEPGGVGDANWSNQLGLDVASSGYAVLCFLGAGYDHRMPSAFKSTVKGGIDWLLSQQENDGVIGKGGRENYHHAIAAMALAEAYAMTNDPRLREPVQKAVDVIIARQNKDPEDGSPYGGLGWDYGNATTRNDGSVAGWNVMALKSAAVAGIEVSSAMKGSDNYLDRAWNAANPQGKALDPYSGKSVFPYVWDTVTNDVVVRNTHGGGNRELACVGLVLAVFLGRKPGDLLLETLANFVMAEQLPTSWPPNTYYLYYNTLGIFQAGGKRWEKWNGTVRDLLVNHQRKSNDCFDGSWDWEGTQFSGHIYGRIFSTAYCCLSLEVYYRYMPIDARK